MGEMKVGHTPGPWTTQEWGDAAIQIIGPSDEEIADLDGDPEGWEVRAANARLIAAAPELLAALELARRWMCEVPVAKRAGNFNIALDRVDAAIAKAEGRT